MNYGEVETLPGGALTIQLVAPGLFEVTYADRDHVVAGLLSAGELQQILERFGAAPTDD
ncbi:MAG: hypothetical protein M3R02_30955 [Chloroflexota bacterium]|nr:hypothetical protein [Chloroflexota bacterium]